MSSVIRGEYMKNNKNSLIIIILIAVIILTIILLGVFSHKTKEPEKQETDTPTEKKIEISTSTLDKDGNLIINIKDSSDKAYYLEDERLIVMSPSIVKNTAVKTYFYITVKNITDQEIDLGENYSLVFYEDDKEVDIYDGSVIGLLEANSSMICEIELSSSNVSKLLFRKIK